MDVKCFAEIDDAGPNPGRRVEAALSCDLKYFSTGSNMTVAFGA